MKALNATNLWKWKGAFFASTFALVLQGCVEAGDRSSTKATARPIPANRDYESQMSSREAFYKYMADLRTNPGDTVARGKVIKIVSTLDPKPARPPELDILVGKGVAAIKNANSKADFANAAAAFAQASVLAPWVGSYYNNTAVAWEKADQPAAAISCYSWYLIVAPNDPNASAIRQHMGELQYAADKAAQIQGQIASLQRSKWVHGGHDLFGDYFENTLVVSNGQLVWIGSKGSRIVYGIIPPSFQIDLDRETLRRYWPVTASLIYKFSADFQSISETTTNNDGVVTESIYYRR